MNKKYTTIDTSQPVVMGILNVTPDSFSDGGKFDAVNKAVDHACQMNAEGAGIIDIGGESTRPGAEPVSVQQEIDRVIPVIESLSKELNTPISIDTSKPEVMREAIKAGASMVNDVYALRAEGAIEAVAETAVPVCLMHMQGEPRTMQKEPHYKNVITEIKAFLLKRTEACIQAGIARDRIMIDPGFGFGKTLQHNLLLLKHMEALVDTGFPVLVGVSRKSMFGQLLGLGVDERLHAGLAAATVAVMKGARIIRTHDIKPTVEALKLCYSIQSVTDDI
ncbi:MAG: dihydropteroate synthase [Gammaproteobacteria bacterium]|nr:dihydropteroate synthase [Gammaproteobacteria bacterium]MDH5593346.1 dihydropteroate synthase [Gammaproteobacteria bacterium]MDH5613426.1 dihydropteroate synthase [Gammaproteobacteria bacterium]